ncbi:MAG: acylase, partial [Rhodanobacteraceae bacterium]
MVPRGCTAALLAALLSIPFCATAGTSTGTATTPTWQTPIAAHGAEYTRLQREARQVTITRDDWGIPHIHGKTDADAVFGMIYAQCEDDFNRVETNYLTALGWSAQAEGESAIWNDL